MQCHASCVARENVGVLLLGPPGCGKSDLALRLLDRGFMLVADDRVDIEQMIARPPAALAGLLEIRGLGIIHVSHLPWVTLGLAVRLVDRARIARLPEPRRDEQTGLPLVEIDPTGPSAPLRVEWALQCVSGETRQIAGASEP